MLAADPYSPVYEAIWNAIEQHSLLAGKVRIGNRIRYDGESRDPAKDQVLSADFPELRIVTTGIEATNQDSTNTRHVRGFHVIIVTGDRRLDEYLFPIEWELFRALLPLHRQQFAAQYTLGEFKWQAQLGPATEGLLTEHNRGIAGWAAVWTLTVTFHFRTSDILP